MNIIQKKTFWYDFIHKTWHAVSKRRKRSVKKTIYWGAQQQPLVVYLERPGFNTPSRMQIHGNVHFGSAKPRLGPLIGILTTEGKTGSFSGVRSNFIDLTKIGLEEGAIVFVFTPSQVNWLAETITGYIYCSTQKSWKTAVFPFPNVVYNRIPSRKQEQEDSVQNCIQALQEINGLTLFNPKFFHKGTLINCLQRSAELSAYVSETEELFTAKELKAMLRKKSHLYIKPMQGMAGSGIMSVRLMNTGQKRYELCLQRGSKPVKIRCTKFSTLWNQFNKYKHNSPYLMQEAIPLTKTNGCPFDFRTLVQKDQSGGWQVTGIGVRVAGKNRITTHVPRGGRIESPERMLKELYTEYEAKYTLEQIRHLALSAATVIEEHYGLLGEMSMDIGLDENRKLWFFEANAKPMKFDEEHIRDKSLRNLIGYAYYLTFDRSAERIENDAVVEAH